MLNHIREPLTNYPVINCYLLVENAQKWFEDFLFIFDCILRNFQRRPHKSIKSNGQIGNKDSAEENAPKFFQCRAKIQHMSQIN
jgi:hypothetical protein